MPAEMDLESAHTSGLYNKRPVTIVRGSGALLWDAEGREYIDCAAGHDAGIVATNSLRRLESSLGIRLGIRARSGQKT